MMGGLHSPPCCLHLKQSTYVLRQPCCLLRHTCAAVVCWKCHRVSVRWKGRLLAGQVYLVAWQGGSLPGPFFGIADPQGGGSRRQPLLNKSAVLSCEQPGAGRTSGSSSPNCAVGGRLVWELKPSQKPSEHAEEVGGSSSSSGAALECPGTTEIAQSSQGRASPKDKVDCEAWHHSPAACGRVWPFAGRLQPSLPGTEAGKHGELCTAQRLVACHAAGFCMAALF